MRRVDRTLYIVASGRFEVLLPGGGVRIGTIEPRSVAGEIAFIHGRPRSATLRALTDAEVFELRFEAFEILAVRHPELGRAILLDLARILAGSPPRDERRPCGRPPPLILTALSRVSSR